MSLVMILIAAFVLLLAGWFVTTSNWPEPGKWFGYAIVFILAIVLFLKITGINI
jgi:hypothetical protein